MLNLKPCARDPHSYAIRIFSHSHEKFVVLKRFVEILRSSLNEMFISAKTWRICFDV